MTDIETICVTLQELQARRKHYIRTTNRLTNAGGALVRRALGWSPDAEDGEKIKRRAASIVSAFLAGKEMSEDDETIGRALATDLMVLRAMAAPGIAERGNIEKQMAKLARQVPAHQWQEPILGFGDIGLAVIVGEAGDLAKYSKVSKLWKRLGLAPMDGHAMSSWRSGKAGKLSAEQWVEAGYNGSRRAEVYACVEASLFKHQSQRTDKATGEVIRPALPYRVVYDKRRAWTALTHPEWKPAQSHADASRVMVKALISDLWSEWRRAIHDVAEEPTLATPAAAFLEAAE